MLKRGYIALALVVSAVLLLAALVMTSCTSIETNTSNLEEIHGIEPQVEQGTTRVEVEGGVETGTSPVIPEEEQKTIDVALLPAAASASQIITVSVADDGTATLTMYSRANDGSWFKSLLDTPAYIGEQGIGETSEGVPITPQGTFPLVSVFGIAGDPGAVLPYTQVDETMYWVSDSESVYYNQLVSERTADDFNRDISEHLIDYWPDYEYVIVMGYNLDRVPYVGSAFFIHCNGEDNFTQGCVAVDRETMKQLVRDVGGNAVIVIDYANNFPYL